MYNASHLGKKSVFCDDRHYLPYIDRRSPKKRILTVHIKNRIECVIKLGRGPPNFNNKSKTVISTFMENIIELKSKLELVENIEELKEIVNGFTEEEKKVKEVQNFIARAVPLINLLSAVDCSISSQ